MLSDIQKIVYKVTGKKNITDDTDFIKDLKLNSLEIMNIVCAFEEKYGIKIPNRDVWKMHKVKDVENYLIKKGVK